VGGKPVKSAVGCFS